jgi:N utilization substance protein B
MGKRRKAREVALQALFQVDFHGQDFREPVDFFLQEQSLAPGVGEFAHQLVEGVISCLSELDRMIETCSDHWKVHRMSRLDRNILRLAAYELTRIPEIPFKVTIDEAIELGKKYGTSESGAFINGILDHLSRKLSKENAPSAGVEKKSGHEKNA